MHDPRAVADSAAHTLTSTIRRMTEADVPAQPGLYAIWAEQPVWSLLGLDPSRASTPLYVGKSQSSLRNREVNTHFAAGGGRASRTGSSTVRRTFAALLAQTLDLQAVPRNIVKPGYFANYSLTDEGDSKLTRWMHEHLRISVWVAPESTIRLRDIEALIIRRWDPPLNIDGAPTPRTELKAARAALARQAEAWIPS